MKKTSWFLFFLLFAVSCLDDPDCFLLSNDVIGISFGVMGSSASDTISFNRISLNDQVLWEDLANDTSVAFIVIPADRILERSRIEMLSNGETRVIDLDYRVKVQFVSEECGPRYIYSDLLVNEHSYDSINVINSTPGRDGSASNIRIYRCPEPDTIGLNFLELTLPATGVSSSRTISVGLTSVTIDETSYPVGRTLSSINLPINTEDTITHYTFEFSDDFGYDEPVRGLAIGYTVDNTQRYRVCGTQKFFSDLEVDPLEAGVPFDQVGIATESNGRLRDVVTDPVSSNVNVYRCPPTNMIVIAFENAAGLARSKLITSVTNDYNAEVLYQEVTASRIQLPLNPAANSTTFTIQMEEVTETVTLNYSWTTVRSNAFPEGSLCRQRPVITDLTSAGNTNVSIEGKSVLYPAITNVILEVAD